jgi:hypothetical protein
MAYSTLKSPEVLKMHALPQYGSGKTVVGRSAIEAVPAQLKTC